MFDDVLGDEAQAFLGADDGLELGPLALEPLLALELLALGSLLEVRVDPGSLGFVERELGQPAFVVDRHCGAILHRALDVVDRDVVAEDRTGVGVGLFDRRAGEADEGGARQGVAHVAGEAVNEVVLAAVRFVGDDHDVAPLGKRRVPVTLLLGQELLDGGKYHPARGHRQQLAQVGPALGLQRRLAQQLLAAGERPEELVVEVVAVGEHHQGRVLHGRLADDAPGVEGHGQALARALGVPDHPDAPVARLTAGRPACVSTAVAAPKPGGAQGLGHGHPHSVELMVAGHLFDEPSAAVILEDNEIAHQIKESPLLEQPLDHHLQLRHRIGCQGLASDGAPGLEPLAPGAHHPDPRLDAVGNDQDGIGGEQRRDLGLVGLQLLPGRPDGGLFVGGVFELQHDQRQAVDEEHHVGPAGVLVLHDRELVHREPVVVVGIVEVQDPGLRPGDGAVRSPVLHRYAVHHQPVQVAVALDQVGALGTGQFAEGVLERLRWKVGIQPHQGIAQALLENHLAVIGALGRGTIRREVGAVLYLPADGL